MACHEGKEHKLIVIYSKITPYDEEEVVRWCKRCGGVVVDKDVDNRIMVGAVREMQFPKNDLK